MKLNQRRWWIIILGGAIGLALGLAVSYFVTSNRWERLSYPALASDKDRAIELNGYDSKDGTMYIKGQSHTIYGCPAEPYHENSDCRRAAPEIAFGPVGCTNPEEQPVDDLPGKVISQLIDCQYMEYFIVQTNYALLEDGSLWKWTYNNFSQGWKDCFIIPGAIFGMVLGSVIGAMFASTRNQPRSSA